MPLVGFEIYLLYSVDILYLSLSNLTALTIHHFAQKEPSLTYEKLSPRESATAFKNFNCCYAITMA